MLFKANIKTGDVKFSTLPLKHVEDYWLLPAPFPWFSLFFITRVCEGYCGPIYEHHVLDARTMRLERLFLGESATLQAILPNGSLLLADNNSFQVLDIEGVQSLCGVLKKEINQGLKNLPTVLVEVVRDYLNQDVNVSAHFASFYNKKRAEENQRAFLRQKAPSDELTSLCCRMM